jgi:hypothetical protein
VVGVLESGESTRGPGFGGVYGALGGYEPSLNMLTIDSYSGVSTVVEGIRSAYWYRKDGRIKSSNYLLDLWSFR